MEELREEELALSGQKSTKSNSGSGSGNGKKNDKKNGSKSGSDDEEQRSSGWGNYLQDAFDRVRTHLARKNSNSSG